MLFVVLFYFEMVSCSPGWPQITYIAQAGLEPLIHLTTSQVLRLYTFTTMVSFCMTWNLTWPPQIVCYWENCQLNIATTSPFSLLFEAGSHVVCAGLKLLGSLGWQWNDSPVSASQVLRLPGVAWSAVSLHIHKWAPSGVTRAFMGKLYCCLGTLLIPCPRRPTLCLTLYD